MKNLLILSLAAFSIGSTALAEDKEAVLKAGKAKYVLCGACHGMDGKGSPAPGMVFAPTFADSKIAGADSAEAMVYAVLKGIKKEDAKYMQIMLPLEAGLKDADLAAVVTYVRNEWAGKDDVITADQVKVWREKYKDVKTQVTRGDLEKMVAGDAKAEGKKEEKKAE